MTLRISQANVSGKTATQIESALEAAAAFSTVELPTLHAHVNRDGTIALATGNLPKGFVWPEDEVGVYAV